MLFQRCVCLKSKLLCPVLYGISGNIGNIFNLAVWWLASKSPHFKHQIHIDLLTILHPCCATAKFNFCKLILDYSLILHKSPLFPDTQ